MRVLKLRSSSTTFEQQQSTNHIHQARIFEFLCLAVRTSPPRHSRTPERELHPVTQRANHSEGAKNSPSCSQLLVRWQDHAHRVRKGSITLYTRSRHSPRCPDEFSTGFRKVPDRRKSIACLSYLNGGFNWRSNYAVRVCQTTFYLFLMIFSHTPLSVYILLNRFQRFNFLISP